MKRITFSFHAGAGWALGDTVYGTLGVYGIGSLEVVGLQSAVSLSGVYDS